jgi:hypothetical protein
MRSGGRNYVVIVTRGSEQVLLRLSWELSRLSSGYLSHVTKQFLRSLAYRTDASTGSVA